MYKINTLLDHNKKNIIFLVLVPIGFLLMLNLAGIKQSDDPKRQEFVVEYDQNGFQPEVVTISTGDKVVFKNHSSIFFWPASNVHPDHAIYPEFDPRQPIKSGDSWTFQFDKVGAWKYHDHITPSHKGLIVVNDAAAERKTAAFTTLFTKDGKLTDCPLKDISNTDQQCWEERIIGTLEQKGITAAFETLADLYDANPSLTGACHGYAHIIGESAYARFSEDKAVELSPYTSYCGFGFYHGFVEAMLLATGDLNEIKQFCEYVDGQNFSQARAASTACYHGIGHGVVDGGDPRAWGNPDAMLEPALEICRLTAETEFQHHLCATGVFNAIEILSILEPKYKLAAIQQDPFAICHKQPTGQMQEACYTNMLSAVLRLTHNDFGKAMEYLDNNIQGKDEMTIDDYTVYEMVVLSLAHEFMRLHLNDPDYVAKGVKWCRSIAEPGRSACFEGLSGGHIKYGEPRNGYVKAVAFCKNNLLTDMERDPCFKFFLKRLRIWYSDDTAQVICSSAGGQYSKKYCQYLYSNARN